MHFYSLGAFLPILYALTKAVCARAQVPALPQNPNPATCPNFTTAQNWTLLTLETFTANTPNVNSYLHFYFVDEANDILDYCGTHSHPYKNPAPITPQFCY